MAPKVFLDANILLDFTLKREGYDAAKKIIELVVIGQIHAFITPLSHMEMQKQKSYY